MLRFLFHKLMHKKGLVLSLLIGNILLIAIASSHAIYQNAALHRMLTNEFQRVVESSNSYPVMFTVTGQIDKINPSTRLWEAKKLAEGLCESFNVKEEFILSRYDVSSLNNTSVSSTLLSKCNPLRVSTLADLEDHIEIVSGRMYNTGINEAGHYEAVISEAGLIESNLIVGDTLTFDELKDKAGNPFKVDIVGVFKNNKLIDTYWVNSPNYYKDYCFIDYDLFYERFLTPIEDGSISHYNITGTWYVQMDYTDIYPDMVDAFISKTDAIIEAYPVTSSSKAINISVTEHNTILKEFALKESRITLSLLILEIPAFALLCVFLFMISAQLMQLEENEISQLKSRGAMRSQIFLIYLLQSLLLAAIAMIFGIPLGSFICQILGSANAFLEFVKRAPLTIHINTEVIVFALVAAALSVLITVLPAVHHSKLSIIDTKQRKSRTARPLWQKLFLDIILIAISLYGYYSFNSRHNELLLNMLEGKPLDPLLFLSSTLFILGLGLFCLRIQPVIVKLIFVIGKNRWQPANFASLLQIIRTGAKQYFIMAFMIFTVSLGIFFATVARTILSNAEKNVIYETGADLVIAEKWRYPEFPPNSGIHVWIEPEISRYFNIPEVESLSKVLHLYDCTSSLKGTTSTIELMAFDTKDYGNTINMDSSILDTHINNYLNTLAQVPNGVLVSENFRELYGYELGDSIFINCKTFPNQSLYMTIVGFFEYWPGYQPTTLTVDDLGFTSVTDNLMIIANYATVLSNWELYPYEIWIKLSDGANASFMSDFVEENNVTLLKYDNLSANIVDIHNDPLFQGTNGILTMSFIIILVLYVIGFLIYWILSIKSRELLFGVLRAMGMSSGEVIHMLINEQIFTGLLSVGFGCVIGYLVTKLFVPLIQIAYSTSTQALPLKLVTDANDMIKLFAIIGIAFVFCMAILTRIVFKMKISEALKLGED